MDVTTYFIWEKSFKKYFRWLYLSEYKASLWRFTTLSDVSHSSQSVCYAMHTTNSRFATYYAAENFYGVLPSYKKITVIPAVMQFLFKPTSEKYTVADNVVDDRW